MPLNLAQTAISALRLGENALTAIYSGIIRVYPNSITVSIDGANASTQSGTAGQPMNPFIYVVNPSNSYGWTAAQISAATLTGLPTGFTATFSSSGSLGSQNGVWSINTTTGNFPNTDQAIAVASLTSTINETGYGTLNVSWGGGLQNGTVSYVDFLGTTITASRSTGTATNIGTLIGSTAGSTITLSSGQPPSSLTIGGVNSPSVTGTAVYTINSIGTSASSINSSISSTLNTNTEPVNYQLNAPPWPNASQGLQAFAVATWNSNSLVKDTRNKVWIEVEYTGSSSGTIVWAWYGAGTGNIQPVGTNFVAYSYKGMSPGTGSYVVKMYGNTGQTAANANTKNSTPAIQGSANWYDP